MEMNLARRNQKAPAASPAGTASSFGDGAVSGAAVMIAAKTAGFALTFGAMAIVARTLTPHDYGLVAMVTSVMTFFIVFSDFGLTLLTVQRPTLSDDQLSTLFWANLGIGLLLGMVTAAIAPLLVWFFGDPQLLGIGLVTALFFPLASLGAQHQAILKRRMMFRRLALVRLTGACAGPIAAVALALSGLGHWALVGQFLVCTGITSVAAWGAIPWRPMRPKGCDDLRSFLGFGGALTGHGIIGYFANNLDNVLLGKFAGAAELGFYNTSYHLMMRPISLAGYGVGETAIPAMSHAKTPEAMQATFRRMFSLSCLLGLPVCAAGAWWADDIVWAVLGEQWLPAIPVLRILFIAAAARMLSTATGWVYVATGRPGRMLRWQILWTPLAVLAFLLGLPFGAVGVAAAYAVALWVAMVPGFLFCFHGTGLRLTDTIQAGGRPLACTLAATAFAVAVQAALFPHMPPGLLRLVCRTAVATGSYAVFAATLVPLAGECFHEGLAWVRRLAAAHGHVVT